MTEQLAYNIYKIVNKIDNKVYIGSTHQSLKCRMYGHNAEARRGNSKSLSKHMSQLDIKNFNIKLIKNIIVPNRKTAKIQEQIEIWKIPKLQRLNDIRAHIPHKYYRGNVEAKRRSRRDYYNRKKKDPEWMAKERLRNKIRMRKNRLKK